MLAMSPPCFNSILGEAEFSDTLLHFPSFLDHEQISAAGRATTISPGFSPAGNNGKEGGKEVKKKLNHNANERDRRKRINSLYSSLRNILPPADQRKKLSIPATVSRVVKYIPELEKEAESLIQKKEKLLNTVNSHEKNSFHFQKKMKRDSGNSLSAISATQINDKEIMVQFSTLKSSRVFSFAQVLFNLEQNGFILLNSSVFKSSEARVFYNLHLQVEGTQVWELEGLKPKLFALFEK